MAEMGEPLDETYFKWLHDHVSLVRDREPARTYWKLLSQLYQKEFVWHIRNDDNRAEDGRQLRYKFIEETEMEKVDQEWLDLPCSVLELLISLSRRLEHDTEMDAYSWFWQLIANLDLHHYHDNKRFDVEKINHILDRFIWRTYKRDGSGGLFPLKSATKDQTKIEIWYQMNAYLIEMMELEAS